MNKKRRKVFRVKDYVRLFEKSLNYIAGAIFSMFAVGIIFVSSSPDLELSLRELFQIIDSNPKKLFCILVAIFSTLPYYFYYTLKDNTDWNACNGSKDNWGLLKICILYEIGIFSFYYLILQGDVEYTFVKLFISIINIILILIYLLFLKVESRSGNRIGYFIVIILLAIAFFVGLFINSYHKLSENPTPQNYTTLLLLVLFSCNAGVNIFFLAKCDSSEEIGIISNRIKIMIPVISIVIYTVSTIYCYLIFANICWIMVMIALWITLYEVAISCIKTRNSRHKVIKCIIFFLFFVMGLPIILYFKQNDKVLLKDWSLKWLILVGISIYIAAIKYWGYILKFLFVDKERTKEKTMRIMVWFRNSILGSMLFISIIIISSEQYFSTLIIIIICSLIAEYFISKYAFIDNIKKSNAVYIRGRVIEFIAIIMPLIIFVLENYLNIELALYLKSDIIVHENAGLIIVGFCTLFMFLYVEAKWKQSKKCKEKQLASFDFNTKSLPSKIFYSIIKNKIITKHVLPDKNKRSYNTILYVWIIYIIIAAVIWDFILPDSNYRTLGLFTIIIIALADWFLLSKCLLDYYIEKMKEGKHMVKFQKIFEKEWKKCLNTLDDFAEIAAEQFKIGDRLRPIMFFLGSSYTRYNNLNDDDYVNIAKAACSLELIHKSSVMFDDFIDGDSMRKGKETFHIQYSDINKMILLGNAMLAKAQTNFVECREFFKCNDNATMNNIKELAQIIVSLCTGCNKELSRANYDNQDQDLNEIKNIIFLETVSLIKGSIRLGYKCFHEDQGHESLEKIGQLGEAFGYVFQYLNDLEPFSQREFYEEHKGEKNHFDYGKKNIALFTLYDKVTPEERTILEQPNPNYNVIMNLYQEHEIEQDILEMVKEEICKINNLLDELKSRDNDWTTAFKTLFNYALEKKGWKEKISSL